MILTWTSKYLCLIYLRLYVALVYAWMSTFMIHRTRYYILVESAAAQASDNVYSVVLLRGSTESTGVDM
jgi:hypothetical protein